MGSPAGWKRHSGNFEAQEKPAQAPAIAVEEQAAGAVDRAPGFGIRGPGFENCQLTIADFRLKTKPQSIRNQSGSAGSFGNSRHFE
jgi:hypothetical protein